MRQFISFGVVLVILTEGSSVKLNLGGNTTLSCSIKDDEEISWIITNGNQTFVRIMKLVYTHSTQSKPKPFNIHPSYVGRITTLSSSTNTHSLLLTNITEDYLMLYCCVDNDLEQTSCTKLEFEDLRTDNPDPVSPDPIIISVWLPVVFVLLLLLLSSVCLCWRGSKIQKGYGECYDLHRREGILTSVQRNKGQVDWTLTEVLYTYTKK